MSEPRPRKRHELKCRPEFFEPTLRGIMRFTLRRDDRGGFQVGDELLLREWVPDREGKGFHEHRPCGYTGREVLVRVDYVMPAETVEIIMRGSNQRFFTNTPPDFVIMSISRVY